MAYYKTIGVSVKTESKYFALGENATKELANEKSYEKKYRKRAIEDEINASKKKKKILSLRNSFWNRWRYYRKGHTELFLLDGSDFSKYDNQV